MADDVDCIWIKNTLENNPGAIDDLKYTPRHAILKHMRGCVDCRQVLDDRLARSEQALRQRWT